MDIPPIHTMAPHKHTHSHQATRKHHGCIAPPKPSNTGLYTISPNSTPHHIAITRHIHTIPSVHPHKPYTATPKHRSRTDSTHLAIYHPSSQHTIARRSTMAGQPHCHYKTNHLVTTTCTDTPRIYLRTHIRSSAPKPVHHQ